MSWQTEWCLLTPSTEAGASLTTTCHLKVVVSHWSHVDVSRNQQAIKLSEPLAHRSLSLRAPALPPWQSRGVDSHCGEKPNKRNWMPPAERGSTSGFGVGLWRAKRDRDAGELAIDDALPLGWQGWHRSNVHEGKHLHIFIKCLSGKVTVLCPSFRSLPMGCRTPCFRSPGAGSSPGQQQGPPRGHLKRESVDVAALW